MKSADEIAKMLLDELKIHINNINNINNPNKLIYYNEMLGDTSFLLAGLLHVLIKKEDCIDRSVWIDDSLITGIKWVKDEIFIRGVMIWGKENTTEQWVDPFHFIIKFNNDLSMFINYIFSFKDFHVHEISYEEFIENRNYYSYNIEKWKYEFKS